MVQAQISFNGHHHPLFPDSSMMWLGQQDFTSQTTRTRMCTVVLKYVFPLTAKNPVFRSIEQDPATVIHSCSYHTYTRYCQVRQTVWLHTVCRMHSTTSLITVLHVIIACPFVHRLLVLQSPCTCLSVIPWAASTRPVLLVQVPYKHNRVHWI